MFGIDKIIKEARETLVTIAELPVLLVDSVMGPVERYRDRRERLKKQSELAEIRELVKILDNLMFYKGDLMVAVERIRRARQPEDIRWLRSTFEQTSEQLQEARQWLLEMSLSNLAAATKASELLGRSSALFRSLLAASDQELLDSAFLADLLMDLTRIQESAYAVFEMIDQHRRSLDCTYG